MKTVKESIQRISRQFMRIQTICTQRLAGCVAQPAELGVLSGTEDEINQAEYIRRKVLASMALHRTTAEQESAMLALMRTHTEAAWWTDMTCAGASTHGIRVLLNRQANRTRCPDAQTNRKPDAKSASTITESRYFVDGENISPHHKCIRDLMKTPNTHIILFTSEHCGWPKEISAINALLGEKVEIERFACHTGTKNAMDFQLVAMVSEYLSSNPSNTAYIVSNDVGYDAAIKMWLDQGFSASRIGGNTILSLRESSANGGVLEFNRETLRLAAERSLHWNGYQAGEKTRLAEIMVKYALGELPTPFSKDIHAAIGHYMECGKRYVEIYAAERMGIESFLQSVQFAG